MSVLQPFLALVTSSILFPFRTLAVQEEEGGGLLDVVVETIFGGNQQAIDRFWGITFAILIVIFTIFFAWKDYQHRRPKGLSKVLAIISAVSFGTIMSGFALACGFGQYLLALILFLSEVVIFILINLIHKFCVPEKTKSKKNSKK